jgi:NCS1 family nucleobase:cation symporter-1
MKFTRPHLAVPSTNSEESSVWINNDIRPLPPTRRTWTPKTYISFLAINQICISNWQQGCALVSSGLSAWQTMISIILGKAIITIIAILNGYVGAEWHIGFPVVSRMVWGVWGAYFQVP